VGVYTALQIFEVLAASAILMYGVLSRSPIVTLLGAGYLIGKAIINILAPEGGTVYRRSIIAYTFSGLYVVGGAILVHFSG
jgi:hypothetical protein